MYNNKNILNECIDRAVKKAIVECKQNTRQNDNIDMIVESVISEHVQMLTEKKNSKKKSKKKKKNTNKKKSVLHWLKSPEVNTAEVRRMLEGEPESQEEEDSKRSYFMKKVNQSHGKEFNEKEINRLYSIKTGLGQ